jgi:hypothetical protein
MPYPLPPKTIFASFDASGMNTGILHWKSGLDCAEQPRSNDYRGPQQVFFTTLPA